MTAAEQLRDWILSEPMSYTTERELQDALWERMLAFEEGETWMVAASREYNLTSFERIDFLIDIDTGDVVIDAAKDTGITEPYFTAVGVEVKVGSALAEVVRQLQRYAVSPTVDELVLVTTKAQHHHVPSFIGGKRVVLCSLVEVGL